MAHPRSRGENAAVRRHHRGDAGSSPLTRGKLYELFEFGEICRLIPAHAGKTETPASWATNSEAHPRSRGENAELGFQKVSGSGSSPLTRGKRLHAGPGHLPLRLIPAHAGKTAMMANLPGSGMAHPRSRGENPKPVAPPEPGWGSSPLTRGKHPRRHRRCPRARLIPAHAGKT